MGNHITYEFDEDGDSDELTLTLEDDMSMADGELRHHIHNVVGHLVGNLSRSATDLPAIRKKPDLRTFRHTMLYKEIKALCGLPPNSKRPSERWSLIRGLQNRENGMAAKSTNSFTSNQQRRIATLFVPNKKEDRLMSLESKVFISKFNKDGSKLITACQDSLVRISDASKGTYHLLNRVKAKDVDWSILDIDFSPCGQYFAYSTWSEYFFVVPVDMKNQENFKWYDLNTGLNRTGIMSIRYSPCGRMLIGGCNNGSIYICDLETRNVKTIKTHRQSQADVNAVCFVNDNDPNLIVSGCNNGILRLWDLRCSGSSNTSSSSSNSSSGSRSGGNGHHDNTSVRSPPASVFLGHLDGITYIDSRNDGNYVLSNSKDQSIKIWDLRKSTPCNKVKKYRNLPLVNWDYRWNAVPREYYNPNEPMDGDVSIMTYRGHRVTKSLLRAKFSPLQQTGQRYIYTGCSTGRIIIYDVLTGHIREAIEGHKDIVRDLSWHPVRSEIVSSSWDTHVNLNTYKRNPLLKSSSSQRRRVALRRSRRIAHRNGDFDDEDEEDEHNNSNW